MLFPKDVDFIFSIVDSSTSFVSDNTCKMNMNIKINFIYLLLLNLCQIKNDINWNAIRIISFIVEYYRVFKFVFLVYKICTFNYF